jgi:Flp pilus assembly protein TadG
MPSPADERGSTMVAPALTLMTLLLLIFGFIEFSRAIYTTSVIQAAAQEGARAGIVNPSLAHITNAVESKLVALDTTMATVSLLPNGDPDVVTVQVEYTFEFVVPIVSNIVGDRLELRSSASMVRQ